jgi:signal transduction histidine kinase
MLDVVARFLATNGYLPHGYCISWSTPLLGTFVVSDLLIFLAYSSMPAALIHFARRRPDFPYVWLLWLFAAFILACGATHLMDVVVLWWPLYGLDAALKVVTALISVFTAVALWPLIPKVLEVPSAAQLRSANIVLEGEIARRAAAERELDAHRHQLEDLVAQRTRELEDAKAVAERANAAKSHFLAAASHDLRQPLSALSLYVGALKGKLADEDPALAGNMAHCVDNLNEMLSDLLDLSRLEAGVVTPEVRDFDLHQVLAKVVSSYGPQANAKGLAVRFGYFTAVGHTDPVLFQRILGNLFSNAVRYTERGGVLIGCRRRDGKLWVEVWDTGIGIPADKTAEIFEEFRQLGNEERNRAKGTGLGLAIVAKAAALLGLQVRVRSRLGRGSVFAVELPRGGSLALPAARSYEHRPLHIALVEDNAQVAGALTYALTAIGHRVVAAASRAELMARLDGSALDIVISDYRLGGGEDGLAVVAALRQCFGARLPALIVTGDTDPAVIRRMSDERVSIQHKPLNFEALCQRIAALTA